MTSAPIARGVTCPIPGTDQERIQLGHGSGGKLSAALVAERFVPRFDNPVLRELGDGAVLERLTNRLVVSTDSFVVRPLEFPGGNIGHLAVHGTLNDLAMMGAHPKYLTAGFILEEGLELDVLDRVLEAMAGAAAAANVPIVTGDTKVVERGSADGLFINTTGIGVLSSGLRPHSRRVRPGDAVLVSGPIGRHGIAVLAARDGLGFEADVVSDTASVYPLVAALAQRAGDYVHALRDPTRGGLASAINEIARAAGVGVKLEESALPVPTPVGAACEMLGLDPLYVANEGIFVAFVASAVAETALEVMRGHPLGGDARQIGVATVDHPGLVTLRTPIGGTRVVDMLPGDQLPRIC